MIWRGLQTVLCSHPLTHTRSLWRALTARICIDMAWLTNCTLFPSLGLHTGSLDSNVWIDSGVAWLSNCALFLSLGHTQSVWRTLHGSIVGWHGFQNCALFPTLGPHTECLEDTAWIEEDLEDGLLQLVASFAEKWTLENDTAGMHVRVLVHVE